jgi:hypothetical protein
VAEHGRKQVGNSCLPLVLAERRLSALEPGRHPRCRSYPVSQRTVIRRAAPLFVDDEEGLSLALFCPRRETIRKLITFSSKDAEEYWWGRSLAL